MKNYYDILGIGPDASEEQIKEAYRNLAKQHHPDANLQKSTDAFKDINEAKQVLLSPEKKAEYDVLLTDFSLYTNFYSKKRSNAQVVYSFISHPVVKLVSALFVIGLVLILYATQEDKPEASLISENLKTDKTLLAKSMLPEAVMEKSVTVLAKKKMSENPPSSAKSVAAKLQPPLAGKKIYKQEKLLLDGNKMANILLNIRVEAAKSAKKINCVQVRQAANSNVVNALQMAVYLKEKGYVIAGREVIRYASKGIQVGMNGNCLVLTIGQL